MKFALISYAKLKGDKYWNLILENQQDVQQYFDASSNLSAKQFLDVWVALKSGQTWPHYFNQRVHQVSIAGACQMISIQAEKTGQVTLVEGCEIHDRLLFKKLDSMIKIIVSGDMIRVSSKGGYSTFDDMYQTHEEIECSENQMREYLLQKDDIRFSFSISKPIVIIENDSLISDELYRKIRNIKDDETLFNFKYRTENWKAEEFFKFFNDGVKNGLNTIIAETSLYDMTQFENLKLILTKVMNANPDHTLEVKLLLNDPNKIIDTSTLPSNLKLTIL